MGVGGLSRHKSSCGTAGILGAPYRRPFISSGVMLWPKCRQEVFRDAQACISGRFHGRLGTLRNGGYGGGNETKALRLDTSVCPNVPRNLSLCLREVVRIAPFVLSTT